MNYYLKGLALYQILMGSITSCCPAATALESAATVLNPCPSDVGQIQKAIFWRSGNSLSLETDIEGLADCDAVTSKYILLSSNPSCQ
mgnify:CR=1 FL=1